MKEPLKYFTPLLDLLVFNGKTWPTTKPCTVTGEDDITASDTTKLSAVLHYRIIVQYTHVSCNATHMKQSAYAGVCTM